MTLKEHFRMNRQRDEFSATPGYDEKLRLVADVCRSNLYQFTKRSWHIVSPERPFVDNWHIGCIAEHLEALTALQIRKLIISMPPRHMKLCADSTPVSTPDGYRTHGDLAVGDMVFAGDGTPAKVVSVSAKGPANKRVTFTTGESVCCNGDHLWTVIDRHGRKPRTMTTDEIQGTPADAGRNRFAIPDQPAVFHPEADLPLHPYFVGCWLGDGTSVKPVITHDSGDTGHIDKLAALGYRVTARYAGTGAAVASEFRHQGFIQTIRRLSLYDDKHIPASYANASDGQRMELLAGLIDTGGHVDPAGRVRISTCDARLAGQIELLAVSLGFRAYVIESDPTGYGDYASTGKAYQVGFRPDREIPTAIPRKRIARTDHAGRSRYIASVEDVADPEDGHCITIDREDGLYLVGRGNLVTHNSLLSSVFWPAWVWLRSPSSQWIFSSYDDVLCERDAMKSRDIVKSAWYQHTFDYPFDIRSDTDSKGHYRNTVGGARICTTPGGAGIGLDADYAVGDDLNSVKDVGNKGRLAVVKMFWGGSMASRGNDPLGLRRLIVQQRIDDDDITGHLLRHELGYEHLCLPCENEPSRRFFSFAEAKAAKAKDPVVMTAVQRASPTARDPRTEEGELLWKNRFTGEAVADLKAEMIASGGAGTVSGQLQQRPSPAEGSIFQKQFFRTFDQGIHPFSVTKSGVTRRERDHAVFLRCPEKGDSTVRLTDLRFFQTADTALTTKTQSSYTAVGTFALAPERRLLVWHVWRGKIEVPYQFAALMALRAGPCRWDKDQRAMVPDGDPWPKPLAFQAIEAKASGIGLIQQGEMEGKPFRVLNTGKEDKVDRSATLASLYYAGRVFHRSGAGWLADFETELLAFPAGLSSDQVDVAAYGGILATSDAILRSTAELGGGLVAALAKMGEDYGRNPDVSRHKVRGEEIDIHWDNDG